MNESSFLTRLLHTRPTDRPTCLQPTMMLNSTVLPTMESFRVLGLESIEPAYAQFEGKMYAGLLPITHESPERKVKGEMMFWMFEPDVQEVDNTLVIWLNGGPGCSVRAGPQVWILSW